MEQPPVPQSRATTLIIIVAVIAALVFCCCPVIVIVVLSLLGNEIGAIFSQIITGLEVLTLPPWLVLLW